MVFLSGASASRNGGEESFAAGLAASHAEPSPAPEPEIPRIGEGSTTYGRTLLSQERTRMVQTVPGSTHLEGSASRDVERVEARAVFLGNG